MPVGLQDRIQSKTNQFGIATQVTANIGRTREMVVIVGFQRQNLTGRQTQTLRNLFMRQPETFASLGKRGSRPKTGRRLFLMGFRFHKMLF